MVSSDGGRGMAPGGCERCWCLVKVVLRQKLTELGLVKSDVIAGGAWVKYLRSHVGSWQI